MGVVKLIANCYPPFHLADILIGVLRGALKIGQRKPKTEFKKPARVKKLATVTYLPQHEQMTQKAMMKTPYDMAIIDPKKAFMAFDCAV